MKLILKLLAVACILFYSTNCFAQKESKKWAIGIFPEYGFPLKEAKQSYHYDAGMTLRVSIHLGPGFVTVSAGGIAFVPPLSIADTANSVYTKLKAGVQIPFKAGYKLIIVHHIFIMGEAGYSSFYNYYLDNNSQVQHTQSGGFTYAGTVGFQLSGFEVGCKYESFQLPASNVSNKVSISNIGIRLGFNF
jgi:hypothetical protein